MTHYTRKLSIIGAALLFGICPLSSALQQSAPPQRNGAGDLLIAPTRVVLEGSKRTAELNLLNIGDKPAMYRISLIHQRMTEDGKLVDIPNVGTGDRFADELVRFTPRQVLLEPHVAQVVRIQVRIPADLETGEYRSHMLFRAVSTAVAPEQVSPGQSARGITVQITPIYGVSIPVIVRHGPMSCTAKFIETHLTSAPAGEPVLVGHLSRSGNSSVYGDLVVDFAPVGQPFRKVTRANGLAIYTPNENRNFALLLSPDKAVKFVHGTLRTSYRRPEADGGQTITSSEIVLP